jgi:hypothetical protein
VVQPPSNGQMGVAEKPPLNGLGVAQSPSFGRTMDKEPPPQLMEWFGHPKMTKWRNQDGRNHP